MVQNPTRTSLNHIQPPRKKPMAFIGKRSTILMETFSGAKHLPLRHKGVAQPVRLAVPLCFGVVFILLLGSLHPVTVSYSCSLVRVWVSHSRGGLDFPASMLFVIRSYFVLLLPQSSRTRLDPPGILLVPPPSSPRFVRHPGNSQPSRLPLSPYHPGHSPQSPGCYPPPC